MNKKRYYFTEAEYENRTVRLYLQSGLSFRRSPAFFQSNKVSL